MQTLNVYVRYFILIDLHPPGQKYIKILLYDLSHQLTHNFPHKSDTLCQSSEVTEGGLKGMLWEV